MLRDMQVREQAVSKMYLKLSPEMLIKWAAGRISDADMGCRRKDEWLWDLAELRHLGGQWARWAYAASIVRGIWLMPKEEACLRRDSVEAMGRAGAYVLGVVAIVLAITKPSSSMMIMTMLLTIPFVIRLGVIVAAGLGIATLAGILWVRDFLASPRITMRARCRHLGERGGRRRLSRTSEPNAILKASM